MPLPTYLNDVREIRRLLLKIERDLLAQTHLRKQLLTAARTLADARNDLQQAKGRVARAQRAKQRRV